MTITKDMIIKFIWAALVVVTGFAGSLVWGRVLAAEEKAAANEKAVAVVDTKMDVLLESLGLGEIARERVRAELAEQEGEKED